MSRVLKNLCIFFVVWNVSGVSLQAAEPKQHALKAIKAPQLSHEPLLLKVAYVVNPRFKELSISDIEKMLRVTQRVSKEHFGLDIRFQKPQRVTIDRLFDKITASQQAYIKGFIIDIKKKQFSLEEKAAFSKQLLDALEKNPTTLAEELTFSKPFLPRDIKIKTNEDLANALTQTLFMRVKKLQKFLHEDNYNEWLYWASLGYTNMDYDLIITNQPIISIETVGADIHPALRGGISVGAIDFKQESPWNAFAFWSTFTFFEKDPFLKSLRGGDYSKDEAIELSGAYLTHELGHMLFRFDHPFGQKACVMNPVPLLDVRTWYQRIDAKKCAIGSSKAMQVGAVTLYKVEDF